jgi:hypothetical protein
MMIASTETRKEARTMPAMVKPLRGDRVEAAFLPNTFEQALEVRDAAIAAGQTPSFAAALMTWLILRAERHPDPFTDQTRASYRRALLALERPSWTPRIAGEAPNGPQRANAA